MSEKFSVVRLRRGARQAKRKLSEIGGLHLLNGCCLFGIGCEVCYGNKNFAPAGVAPYSLRPEARKIWEQHKTRLLGVWYDTDQNRGPKSNFSPEAVRGKGKFFPSFGEIIFDGALLPKKDRKWPHEAKKTWDMLAHAWR